MNNLLVSDEYNSDIRILLKSSDSIRSSDGGYIFSISLESPGPNYYVLYRLFEASIPYSFYQCNSYNNKLVINSIHYSITPGNYNAYSLQEIINNMNLGITLSYQRSQMKYIITSDLPFDLSGSTCLNFLGLSEDNLISENNVICQIHSDKIINMNSIDCLFFYSNISSETYYIKNNIETGNLLFSHFVDKNPGQMMFFSDINDSFFNNSNRYFIDQIVIHVLDQNNNIIDFQGNYFYLNIQIRFHKYTL
jgi:hypothetical protein